MHMHRVLESKCLRADVSSSSFPFQSLHLFLVLHALKVVQNLSRLLLTFSVSAQDTHNTVQALIQVPQEQSTIVSAYHLLL